MSTAQTKPAATKAAVPAAQTGWRLIQASFEKSAPKLRDAPPGDLPEIAVTGRSNVGKSSLLNAFANQRGLARVSRTPGRTQLLNFFRMQLRHPSHGSFEFRWVDLPGYGYSATPQAVRASFGPMIEGYLQGRTTLRGLVVLIDCRREVSDHDHALLEFMQARNLPVLVCATKADKLSKHERGLISASIARTLEIRPRQVLLTSADTGLGLGDAGREGGLARELADLLKQTVDEATPTT